MLKSMTNGNEINIQELHNYLYCSKCGKPIPGGIDWYAYYKQCKPLCPDCFCQKSIPVIEKYNESISMNIGEDNGL